MKKLFFIITLFCGVLFSSCSETFDDSKIWDKLYEHDQAIKDHEQRISALEELCKQMNTNISSLQTIVTALQNNDYVTGVAPITKDGETIGYTITFSKSEPITIYHGKDGTDGKDGADGIDGYTPQIGVKQDTDNVYYWTLDGEWMLDAAGNKIKAVGEDGKDGVNGTDGKDGQDGKDGVDGTDGKDGADGKDAITPQLKIENDYWYISYDNGATWTKLGKATGEDGQDGYIGKDGKDGVFIGIFETASTVTCFLSDGSSIVLSKPQREHIFGSDIINFADHAVKSICVANWDTDGDGEISYDEAKNVWHIGDEIRDNTEIRSFDELQYFTSLYSVYLDGCTNLRSVILPESVVQCSFTDCTNLTKVAIPNQVIDVRVDYCASLKTINIPATAESFSLYGCENLESVFLAEGLTKIPYGAFGFCRKLVNITIPSSVTEIESEAFEFCESLTHVYCKAAIPPTVGSSIFYGIDWYWNLHIYVPIESVEAYKSADGWSEYADKIVGYDFE